MENIEKSVQELLNGNDGHGFDHVERVRSMALKFAQQENADLEVVELASLLHDVDDYKIFGEENAKHLHNANKILNDNGIDDEVKSKVINIIKTMGYSNYLNGVRPTTIEGQVVSDADMCDAIGAQGILRTHAYNASKGNNFFDKDSMPQDSNKTVEQYKSTKSMHAVQHFFDKLLIINDILMTEAGRQEGDKRQKIMVDFLSELFREEESKVWQDHLGRFTK